tara:strand:- start:2095 stop:3012 length:918 start_codon:yes stop_codon:yes gene_type:complete
VSYLNNLNVIFAGCAKNCEKYLPDVFSNIKSYSSIFKKSFKIIVENGSSDDTKKILKKHKNDESILHFRDDLNLIEHRTIRLASARNLIIEEIKNNQKLKDFDLLIMLDFDDRSIFKIEENNLIKAIEFLFSKNNIAAVFGNQPDLYFDMWALMDEHNFKGDYFGDALKFATSKMQSTDKITKEILFDLKKNYFDKKKISFSINSPPIKVISAFGGLGIYKIKKIIENKNIYEGEQEINIRFKDGVDKNIFYQRCEHKSFHQGFNDINSDLFILPYLINSKKVDFEIFPQSAFALVINKENLNIF